MKKMLLIIPIILILCSSQAGAYLRVEQRTLKYTSWGPLHETMDQWIEASESDYGFVAYYPGVKPPSKQNRAYNGYYRGYGQRDSPSMRAARYYSLFGPSFW